MFQYSFSYQLFPLLKVFPKAMSLHPLSFRSALLPILLLLTFLPNLPPSLSPSMLAYVHCTCSMPFACPHLPVAYHVGYLQIDELHSAIMQTISGFHV